MGPQRFKTLDMPLEDGSLITKPQPCYPYPEALVHLFPHFESTIMSSSYSSEYYDASPIPLYKCRTPRHAKCQTLRDCRFFDWYDLSLNTHYKELILRLKAEADGDALAEAEQKLEAAEARTSKLKQKLANMKEKAMLEVGTLKEKYEALNLRAKVIGAAFGSLVVANGVMLVSYYLEWVIFWCFSFGNDLMCNEAVTFVVHQMIVFTEPLSHYRDSVTEPLSHYGDSVADPITIDIVRISRSYYNDVARARLLTQPKVYTYSRATTSC
ncbi:hypothetical protein LXL04_015286 [Taraxacum kok-saghyz]